MPQTDPSPTAPSLPAAARTALADLRLRHADHLPADRRASYVSVFRVVPRPPRLLHQLLSLELSGDTGAAELAELIRPDPVLAAKVLATAGSPPDGSPGPVAGVDQAVILLGIDRVRGLCLQALLSASFKTDHPERRRLLDRVWIASTVAGELARRLALPLGLGPGGPLVGAVLLSFLGRLATVAATPVGILAGIPARSLLERTDVEQRKLGLSASEIGRLLMAEWQLPAEVTADAADADRLLAQTVPDPDPQRSNRLALGYLCARLGERLAHGELAQLCDFDLDADTSPELLHLRAHLDPLVQARLPGLLKDPALGQATGRMQPALH